ncbi:carboxymuconolactone decarboxylase family protein [Conexibacter sp. CPCC 206217]|uniref:carboxymuconolactone decarboxylase family protein n=1 Tax=Conexibacter sp. CPCC 206217 TaxID=3064574 RepID=UPI0027219194|nr:carboxymuconolactone decarboxylase family protein [Conexibacter sp. CPCC 206217]MDO8211163.1 carboxymuconolactone decarboxylase family protein [Conexibacter sp. CPCC 206217]
MEDELYATGIKIREQMWGPGGAQAKVDAASDFQRDLELLVTRYCFGATWGREALDHRTRSMLTMAMLVAQGRGHELGVHVAGAISNGVTKDEIKEILLHAAIYCGVPASVEAFRTAEPVLDRLGAK